MNERLRLPPMDCRKITLNNGLDVIVRRQGELPIVSVNLWYHVGSKDEERRQRGFAHLFEHLMFEGSEHYPGDFFKPLQRVGASLNGSTSTDRTNYFEDVPSAHLELALAMESDRMGHLLPALDDAKLRIQKDVVKNEYRQNYANRPYGMVWKLLAEALYPPQHPYSWLTIGAMEDVEAATLEDVAAFFRRYYVPGNASLAIVGAMDEDRAFKLAERYFAPIPGGVEAVPPWTPRHDLAGFREITFHDRVELDRLYEVWPTVPQFQVDDAPLALLSDLLTRGKSSRLYRLLVVEEGLAQDVSSSQAGRELAGTFIVVVTLRPERDWTQARELVLATISELAEHGPTEEEWERVKNSRLAGFVYALDNVGGFGGVADRLNAYNTYLGCPDWFGEDLERYQRVTVDDLREAARRYLVNRPSVRLTVLGRKPSTLAPRLDRGQVPRPAPAVPFQAPTPLVYPLRCGSTLWALPRRDLPIVAGTVVVPAGASVHGPRHGGLASLTAEMMDEGTHRHSAQELARTAEGMGTILSSSCGWDGSYIGFQCLTPYLSGTLDLAVDVLRRPSFPTPEWNRIQAQTLAALRSQRDSAEARAHRGLLRAIYGHDHPYGVPLEGDEATVSALTREDLIGFHAAHYGPEGSVWVMAGDFDPDRMVRLLDEHLTEWRGSTGSRPLPPQPERTPGRRLILLDRPGSAQAVLRVGQLGAPRLDPDYSDLLVLNQILGGQFSSRLNERLREQKGLTYGVRSHFDFRRGAGPFSIGTSVQTDRAAEALAEIARELESLVQDRPPTLSELEDARRSLIEGQARHFENPSALVSRYAGLFVHGLPPNHHDGFSSRLDAVTVESLAEAARRHLHPDRLVALVVADTEQVRGSLEQLGWESVELRSDGPESSSRK